VPSVSTGDLGVTSRPQRGLARESEAFVAVMMVMSAEIAGAVGQFGKLPFAPGTRFRSGWTG